LCAFGDICKPTLAFRSSESSGVSISLQGATFSRNHLSVLQDFQFDVLDHAFGQKPDLRAQIDSLRFRQCSARVRLCAVVSLCFPNFFSEQTIL
jgi:hypothetical protein